METEIALRNKMMHQLEYVLNNYSSDELKEKLYLLMLEWYMEGLHVGLKSKALVQIKSDL